MGLVYRTAGVDPAYDVNALRAGVLPFYRLTEKGHALARELQKNHVLLHIGTMVISL